MSSISNATQGLFQYLSSVNSNSQSSQTDADNTTANDGADLIAGTEGGVQHHHGHHDSGQFQQIQSAVTNALESATGSTTGTTDPNTIVQNAIAQILGQTATGSTTAATDQPGADGTSSTGSNFMQTLQEHGIDPEQFRQDFMAAFQSLGSSQNSSTPSQTIPPGSIVNTTI